ncbi:conserved hypothetical protein [Ricinus communis]|uniref:Uncharacterized protein n=1 Tax=Ricinus communis TaxID=3988 RepID=B9TAF8_RICCO|nr:conserved hypothetical protein [Ricinus communis]
MQRQLLRRDLQRAGNTTAVDMQRIALPMGANAVFLREAFGDAVGRGNGGVVRQLVRTLN